MPEGMPGLAILIAKHKPKDMMSKGKEMDEPMDSKEPMEDSPNIHLAIAHSLIAAVKAEDAEEVAKCLKDFVELCHEPEGKAE